MITAEEARDFLNREIGYEGYTLEEAGRLLDVLYTIARIALQHPEPKDPVRDGAAQQIRDDGAVP